MKKILLLSLSLSLMLPALAFARPYFAPKSYKDMCKIRSQNTQVIIETFVFVKPKGGKK